MFQSCAMLIAADYISTIHCVTSIWILTLGSIFIAIVKYCLTMGELFSLREAPAAVVWYWARAGSIRTRLQTILMVSENDL